MSSPVLSKSLFKLGLECPLRIKHALARPTLPRRSHEDEYLRMLAEGGYMFEKLVRIYHPGKDLYIAGEAPAAASARTIAKLQAGDATFHEATFAHGGLMARTDMVRVHGEYLDLIEIKSASAEVRSDGSTDSSILHQAAWQNYVVDLAYQVHVAGLALQAAGIRKTIRAWFYVPNIAGAAGPEEVRGLFSLTPGAPGSRPEVTYRGQAKPGDPTTLIAILDATEAVARCYPQEEAIAEAATRLSGHIQSGVWPTPELGLKCKDCEFNVPGQTSGYDACWGSQARAEHHLFTLSRLGNLERSKPGLVQRYIATSAPRAPRVTDLEDEDVIGKGSIAAAWKRQILAVRTGQPFRSEELTHSPGGLMHCLPENYPLFFLDYEGTRCALPSAPGARPYGQVAFQWSCHVIDRPGAALRHTEWLDTETENPTVGFLTSLRKALGEQGTIYHWAPYEVSVTQELANEIRGEAKHADLVAWADRTWGSKETGKAARPLDLLTISREHFYDPLMKGSHSIKQVLPSIWKSPDIRLLFPQYTKDPAGQPTQSPYDALPALTLQQRDQSALPLQDAEALDIVKNGTGAMRAYEHIRYGLGSQDPALRADLRGQLLRYCQLDTAAMVMIWRFWLG